METRELSQGVCRDVLFGSGEDALVVVPDYHGCSSYARRSAHLLAGFLDEIFS